MFTGLIEEVAVVQRVERTGRGANLHLAAKTVLEDIKLGDSIAVNGACLTVVRFSANVFAVDAVPETLRRTTIGTLAPGDKVNLERAIRVGDRLGGHFVSGHVDGVGRIVEKTGEGIAAVIVIAASPSEMRYIAEKGSICIDGVSLTVMDVTATTFRVSVIPHTGQHTTLLEKHVGAGVNLECDMIAKYVERLLDGAADVGVGDGTTQAGHRRQGLTMEALRTNGFA